MKDKVIDTLKLPLPHERLPKPRIYLNGKPVLLLPRGSFIEHEDEFLIKSAVIAEKVHELISPCFGPYSTYKLILSEDGATFLTNDALTIFNKLKLDDPVAQVLAGAGIDTHRATGGGSVTCIILATAIISKLSELRKAGFDQQVLIKGLLYAYREFMRKRYELSFKVDDRLAFIDSIVKTSLDGKILSSYRSTVTNIITEAIKFMKVLESNDYNRLDNIYIRTLPGSSFAESRFVRGLALMREQIHASMPSVISNGKLVLVKGEFQINQKGNTSYYDHKISIEDPSRYSSILSMRRNLLLSIFDRLLVHKPDLILVERGVDELVVDYAANKGITIIRRFSPQEFDHVVAVLGAIPVTDLRYITESDLIPFESLTLERIAGSTWWFIEGFTNAKGCEILIRGPNELFLQEAERLILSIIKMIKYYLVNQRITFGGGWFEYMLSKYLIKYAKSIPSKEQIVIEKISEAFQEIPMLLAKSSGLDPIDTVIEMNRLYHNDLTDYPGVDCNSRRVFDMKIAGIVEPYHVKEQSIISALQAAYTILRIDHKIVSRRLTKEESYYVERVEKTSPEERNKLYREYGI